MAATRKGATLEFTEKEAFLSYLNAYRTLLLNYSPDAMQTGPDLENMIETQYNKLLKLRNPVMLWKDPLKNIKGLKYPHIRLTG